MQLRACLLFLFLKYVFAAEITDLPGASPVPWKQYAGYFDVGTNNHLHYWFVESQNDPTTDPVLLWLTGGPGCSGLSALLTEWGPFLINTDGTSLLRVNPYSWNRNASILTIESPAGVGYSYSDGDDLSTDDVKVASENWDALKGFFTEFPQFKTNDFYVTGESYGGVYVPTLVQTILDRQSQFNINIKGFAIGNGCVSDDEGTDSTIQFLYNHGLVDDQTWQNLTTDCCNNKIDDCPFHSFNDFDFCGSTSMELQFLPWEGDLNPYNLYADCVDTDGKPATPSKRFLHDVKRHTGRTLPDNLATVPCIDESDLTNYLDHRDVRDAIQVKGGLPNWDICSDDVRAGYTEDTPDTSPYFKRAIDAGLRVLLYYGDVDMACNFLMGQRFSRNLGYTRTKAKSAFTVDGQIAGYHTKYGSLDFVTIRGAGHMVPTDKPAVSLHVIDSWLSGRNP